MVVVGDRPGGLIVNEQRCFEVREQAGVMVVTLCKSRYVDHDVLELESHLVELVQWEQPQKLLIDMRVLELTTNAVHKVLLDARNAVAHYGGQLQLCNLTPPVREIMQMLHLLENIFEVHDTTEEALEAFAEEE
ncbi:MAG: hypothetical protein HYV60_04240 [Planctomycetia bacterium]|nr:hypothetical protein [Planctomycetia bacterium]